MTAPGDSSLSRRRLLQALSVGGIASLAGCGLFTDSEPRSDSSPAPTPTTVPSSTANDGTADVPFDRTVNLVDDLGASRDGSEPINGVLSDALEPGTRVVVPGGTYMLDGPIDVSNRQVGFVGDGDAVFRLPEGFSGKFLRVNDVDAFLFRGIDVDMRGDRRGGMQVRSPTKFHIEDVEYLGRGGLTGQAFNLGVTQPWGTGRLANVRVPHGGHPDRYDSPNGTPGNGRIGVWAGLEHEGTLRVEQCEFSEFGNNGMYTSRNLGKVQVLDSHFENNNVSSIRLSGKGSYAQGCTVTIDFRRYNGPALTDTEQGFNPRAIMIDGANATEGVPRQKPGAEIRNCAIRLKHIPSGSVVQSAIEQNPAARSLRVRDTLIEIDLERTPAVRRARPGSGPIAWRPRRDVPPKPHWTRLENVTITGTASKGSAVKLNGADGSELAACQVKQPSGARNGVSLSGCENVTVDEGNYVTGGYPFVIESLPEGGCSLQIRSPPQLTQRGSESGSVHQLGPVESGDACAVTRELLEGTGSSTVRITGIRDGSVFGTTGN